MESWVEKASKVEGQLQRLLSSGALAIDLYGDLKASSSQGQEQMSQYPTPVIKKSAGHASQSRHASYSPHAKKGSSMKPKGPTRDEDMNGL